MRYLLLSVFLIFTLAANAEMYRWVDEHGKVHFSDKPVNDGAKAYKPKPLLVVPADSGAGSGLQPLNRPDNKQVKYQGLKVTSPANDQVFTPDKSMSVAVAIQVKPGLQAGLGHKVALYLNGQLYSMGNELNFTLNNLNRGTYTVHAAILDQRGKKLKSSESISFHIQKHHL